MDSGVAEISPMPRDQPALDRKQVGGGPAGRGLGRRTASPGRSRGRASAARLVAKLRPGTGGCRRARRGRALPRRTPGPGPIRPSPIPSGWRSGARCSRSKRGERDPAPAQFLAAGGERGDRQVGLAAKPVAALDLGAKAGGASADHRKGRGEQRADLDHLVDRAGLDQRQRRRPPRHGLESGGEPDDRPLLFGEPGALGGAKPLDQPDPRLGGGDVGLGRLDPGGERRRPRRGRGRPRRSRGAPRRSSSLGAAGGSVGFLLGRDQGRALAAGAVWAAARPAAPASDARIRTGSSRPACASPFTMIGVVRKDRGGAPQLLGEHRSGEKVRPGRPAEGEQQVGRRPGIVLEAVGPADQEARLAAALVAPALEPARELRSSRAARLSRRAGW